MPFREVILRQKYFEPTSLILLGRADGITVTDTFGTDT